MNWRNLWNRLRGRPGSLDRDLDEELAFHQEMRERDLARNGLSGIDATTAARRAIGNLTLAREDARDAWQFQ